MRKLAFASPMVNQILIRSWWGWSRGVVEPLKLTLPLFFLMAFFFFLQACLRWREQGELAGLPVWCMAFQTAL